MSSKVQTWLFVYATAALSWDIFLSFSSFSLSHTRIPPSPPFFNLDLPEANKDKKKKKKIKRTQRACVLNLNLANEKGKQVPPVTFSTSTRQGGTIAKGHLGHTDGWAKGGAPNNGASTQ